MDYEKKYKDTLERAKQLLRTSVAFDRFTIERIFPELKENEDERVRKAIISGMKALQEKGKYTEFANIPMDEVFTWLEKQVNKSINIDIESMVSSYKQRLKNQAGIKMENNPLVNMCLSAFRRGVENTLEELNLRTLEKQGEQKPVEPQQDMLSQEKYAKAVDECIYGEQKPVNVDYVSGIREELLSIEDSAENIVGLAESQWVAIRAAYRLLGEYIAKEQKLADKVEPKFKVGDIISNGISEAKIVSIDKNYYNVTNDEIENDANVCNWVVYFKNQDDWKLVEQKSYWGKEDERIYKVIVELLNSWSNGTIGGCVIPPNTDRYINWFKSLKDKVQPQKKQELGEEDCNRISSIKYLLHELDNYNFDNWLDSLKERYTWKPSDE